MRNPFLGFGALVVLVVALILGSASVYTVAQTELALVLRFGEPVGGKATVQEPGLHFKIPFIETVVYFDKRILDVETPKQEVLAADNNRIEVDAFLRYRIVNPLEFYRAVRTEEIAANQLGSVMNSVVRRVLGEATMIQIVRDNRANMVQQIKTLVNAEGVRLGVEVIDVRIRRADLPRQISEAVYGRMRTEREREAADFRAQGQQRKQEIESKADRDVTVLRAEAMRKSEEFRGEGDAERNKIFADAYQKDAEFFSFYRSMQAYEKGLTGGDTRMILSPNSDFFRYFGDPAGREAAGGKPAGGAPQAGRPAQTAPAQMTPPRAVAPQSAVTQ